MEERYLTIGEVAKLTNVSIQTLRYYDQIDLFKPSYTDPHTNYRFYKDAQLYHLDLIKSLKHLSISLEEIKNVQQQSPEQLLLFLEKQEQVIVERVNKLKEVHQTLLKTKRQMNEQLSIPTYNEIYQKKEEEERILMVQTENLTPEYIPNSYYTTLKMTVENEGSVIPSRYGCIYPFKHYEHILDIQYDYIFTPLMTDRYIQLHSDNLDVQVKKAGTYICIAFIFDPNTYFERYKQLRDYVISHALNVYPEVYEIFMPRNYSPFKEDEFIVELKLRLHENV